MTFKKREPSRDDVTWDSEHYGIYATEDDAPPIAMFASLDLARRWLAWMEQQDELGCDYCIVLTSSTGIFRNRSDAVEAKL